MNEKMIEVEYKGKKYPLIFTLNCMEEIQEKYGSLSDWYDKLGKNDDDKEPSIKDLKYGMLLMINEGIEIKNEDVQKEEDKMPLIDLKTVGRIITALGLREASNKIGETIKSSSETGEEAKNE